MNDLRQLEDRDALRHEVTEAIARTICDAVEARGEAFIALSGGSTPGPVYERLGALGSVPWRHVTVTLCDERLTAPGDPLRNEELVRATLLQGSGAEAKFVPIKEGQTDLPKQDLALLGMGTDGHFASLFPTAKELEAGLSDDAPPVLRMTPDPLPDNAPFPRLSLSLPAIVAARKIVLAFTGEEKLKTFRKAQQEGPVREYPVRALLGSDHPDLTFYWAP